MLIDKKGKIFGKISVIDIIILAVVIAAVAGLSYKFTNLKTSAKDDITIQFYSEESPDFTVSKVNTGDIVKDPVKNTVFGKVTDKKIDKSIVYSANSKGEIVVSTKPNSSSILITTEGKGSFSKSGVTIGTADYTIGKTMEIRVGNTSFWVRVYNIQKKG